MRSLRKSLCSGFSTSTTPHGYKRPRIFFPFTSISWLEPITANGMLACAQTCLVNLQLIIIISNVTSDLQDTRLLLELFVLVRIGIGQLIDADPLLADLIQNLTETWRHQTFVIMERSIDQSSRVNCVQVCKCAKHYYVPVAQLVEHCVHRKKHIKQIGTVFWMHSRSLWIKTSVKSINVMYVFLLIICSFLYLRK